MSSKSVHKSIEHELDAEKKIFIKSNLNSLWDLAELKLALILDGGHAKNKCSILVKNLHEVIH
jgi:hypothetical protein